MVRMGVILCHSRMPVLNLFQDLVGNPFLNIPPLGKGRLGGIYKYPPTLSTHEVHSRRVNSAQALRYTQDRLQSKGETFHVGPSRIALTALSAAASAPSMWPGNSADVSVEAQ